MFLWKQWYSAIAPLRPAFSRGTTYLWFVACVAGISVRSDSLGVSSVVRALGLDGHRSYASLLRNVHSSGVDLQALSVAWTRIVTTLLASRLERVAGRIVLVADGKKVARSGRKMPGVKSLHQQSESNRASQAPSPPSSWAIRRRWSRCSRAPRTRCTRRRWT